MSPEVDGAYFAQNVLQPNISISWPLINHSETQFPKGERIRLMFCVDALDPAGDAVFDESADCIGCDFSTGCIDTPIVFLS